MQEDTLLRKVVEEMIRADRRHHALCDRETAVMNIHRSQNRMLGFLYYHGESTQREIADGMHISPAVVTVTLRKLFEEGYVTRRADIGDKRAMIVTLTEQGSKIVKRTRAILDRIDEQMFQGFAEKDLQIMLEYYRRIRENLQRAEEEEQP